MSFAAFAIAMAIFPLHTWMVEAQSKASPGVAAILSGTMLMLGAYGMMRISLVVFPVPAHYYSFAITGLAVVGAFWGSIGALRQDELRRFIAYMNVAQMSMVLLAIGAQTSVALVGAILLLCGTRIRLGDAHADQRRGRGAHPHDEHSRDGRAGRAGAAPRRLLALRARSASSASPRWPGFTGDFMVFAGSFPEHRIATVLVMASVIVTTGGLLWVANRVFFGPVRDQFVRVRDVTLLDLTVLIPLVGAVLHLRNPTGRDRPGDQQRRARDHHADHRGLGTRGFHARPDTRAAPRGDARGHGAHLRGRRARAGPGCALIFIAGSRASASSGRWQRAAWSCSVCATCRRASRSRCGTAGSSVDSFSVFIAILACGHRARFLPRQRHPGAPHPRAIERVLQRWCWSPRRRSMRSPRSATW